MIVSRPRHVEVLPTIMSSSKGCLRRISAACTYTHSISRHGSHSLEHHYIGSVIPCHPNLLCSSLPGSLPYLLAEPTSLALKSSPVCTIVAGALLHLFSRIHTRFTNHIPWRNCPLSSSMTTHTKVSVAHSTSSTICPTLYVRVAYQESISRQAGRRGVCRRTLLSSHFVDIGVCCCICLRTTLVVVGVDGGPRMTW